MEQRKKKIYEVLSVPIAHNTEEVSDNFLLSKVSILISKSYWKIEWSCYTPFSLSLSILWTTLLKKSCLFKNATSNAASTLHEQEDLEPMFSSDRKHSSLSTTSFSVKRPVARITNQREHNFNMLKKKMCCTTLGAQSQDIYNWFQYPRSMYNHTEAV